MPIRMKENKATQQNGRIFTKTIVTFQYLQT